MNHKNIIIVLSLTMATLASADEYIGITKSSFQTPSYTDVQSYFIGHGYVPITNTLFDGVLLIKNTTAKQYSIIDLGMYLTDRQNTNATITIMDARTSRILAYDNSSLDRANTEWLEKVLESAKRLPPSASEEMVRCGFNGYSRLSPQNQQLAILLRQQVVADKYIIALDRELLSSAIQLQDELNRKDYGLTNAIVGQMEPLDLVVLLDEETGGRLVARAIDSITGTPIFNLPIADSNDVVLVVKQIKMKKPQQSLAPYGAQRDADKPNE